ncbi:unnamed protein product [Paramecium sonneborni]|uniref:Choline transporter-like protein n=1 Tax=Paramecium sonneborni TaxID=65129 RepID=A0A8S1R2J7_9CILI|nr:unnamed protein product [Paramecium sonneborni]
MKVCRGFLYFAVMIVCLSALTGIYLGKPNKIARGFDSDAYACGVDPGLEDYPYAYFVNPTPEYKYRILCVKQCPTVDSQLLDCAPNTEIPECTKQTNVLHPEKMVSYYESFIYKGNVCMPTSLEYYDGVKDFSSPGIIGMIINDFMQTWHIIALVSCFIIFACSILLEQLKANTTYVVWTFSMFSLLIIGAIGIYFISQWNFARNYQTEQAIINNFKVNEEYIYKMTNQPNQTLNFVFGIIFVLTFLYGMYWLYKNSDRVQDLADIFEYVENFMKENPFLLPLNYVFLGFLLSFIILLLLTCLFLGSTFKLKQDSNLGPFEKIELNTLITISTGLVFVFVIWIIQVINGSYQSIIFCNFKIWINNIIARQQSNNIDSLELGMLILYCSNAIRNLNLQIISKISFALLFSPIKLVLDFIKDTFTDIFKIRCNPFKFLSTLEEVLYYEVDLNQDNISPAILKVKEHLQINEDGAALNTFEIIRNINDFFLLIVKVFACLICVTLFLIILSIINFVKQEIPLLQQTLQINLYQPLIPAFIVGLIGYQIAQIYFCQYTTVQCFGYAYISACTQVQTEFQQHVQNYQGQPNQQFQDYLQSSNQALFRHQRLKIKFPELKEMIERTLPKLEELLRQQNN